MQRIRTEQTGGFNFTLDDLETMQTNVKELTSAISESLSNTSQTFILYGCNISVTNSGGIAPTLVITKGAIWNTNEIFLVDAVSTTLADYTTLATVLTDYFWDLSTVTDTPRVFYNTNTYNVREIKKAIFTTTPTTWINVQNLINSKDIIKMSKVNWSDYSNYTFNLLSGYTYNPNGHIPEAPNRTIVTTQKPSEIVLEDTNIGLRGSQTLDLMIDNGNAALMPFGIDQYYSVLTTSASNKNYAYQIAANRTSSPSIDDNDVLAVRLGKTVLDEWGPWRTISMDIKRWYTIEELWDFSSVQTHSVAIPYGIFERAISINIFSVTSPEVDITHTSEFVEIHDTPSIYADQPLIRDMRSISFTEFEVKTGVSTIWGASVDVRIEILYR